MKFIIHAGLHKTGTTSIQNFCGTNKNSLKAVGIYYPSFAVKPWLNHSIPLSLICRDGHGVSNHSVVSIFKTDEDRTQAANNIHDYFKNEINQQSDISSVLLSGEDISVFKLEELQKFKELLFSCGATEIQFICYVRNPIDFVLSGAQELVKAGLYQFGDAIRIGNLQKARHKLQKIQDVFGKENVKILSYDLAIMNGNGIIDHFLNLLGVHSYQANELKMNSSMGLEKCLTLSALVKIKDRAVVKSMGALLDNRGTKIVSNDQINQYLVPLNQDDREFLSTNHQIAWEISEPISKVGIDLNLFDTYLSKVCSYDSSIRPAKIITTILEDITDLYPEVAKSLTENYSALISSSEDNFT
jgi:hypothetical protein